MIIVNARQTKDKMFPIIVSRSWTNISTVPPLGISVTLASRVEQNTIASDSSLRTFLSAISISLGVPSYNNRESPKLVYSSASNVTVSQLSMSRSQTNATELATVRLSKEFAIHQDKITGTSVTLYTWDVLTTLNVERKVEANTSLPPKKSPRICGDPFKHVPDVALVSWLKANMSC